MTENLSLPKHQLRSSRLETQGLRVDYGGQAVLDNLTVALPDRQVTTIIGPNGCGKSTLLRSLIRLLPTRAGSVQLDGQSLATIPTKRVARMMGLLPQSPTAPAGLTVYDLVSRGRYPHQSWHRQWSAADEEAVAEALQLTATAELSGRLVESLSGGQRQRVWIAMVLAQETEILLLDEPTTYLDLAHAIEVLELVENLCAVHGKTIVMVLHDLNLAARYSDSLVVMRDGEILAQGAPAQVMTPELLKKAFGLVSQVLIDPLNGGPLVVPMSVVRN